MQPLEDCYAKHPACFSEQCLVEACSQRQVQSLYQHKWWSESYRRKPAHAVAMTAVVSDGSLHHPLSCSSADT